MRTDAFLDFQRSAAASQAITATALSTDYLDQLAKRDLGAGRGLCIATTVTTAFAATYSSDAVTTTIATELFTLATHGLLVGQPIVFDTVVTTTGVTEGTVYYVTYSDNTDASNFCIATTKANALAGTVALIAGGDGTANVTTLNTLEVQAVLGWDEASTVDPANSEGFQIVGSSGPITIREARNCTFDATGGTYEDMVTLAGHGFSTGTPVTFGGGGTIPTGLTAGQKYYVIWKTDNIFQVATSYANARAGTRVDFSTDGSGELAVTIADGLLGANSTIITPIDYLPADIGERYLRVRYVADNGAFTAGAVRSHLVMDADLSPKNYPLGYTVQ